jgi:hypothetical protein
MKLKDFLLLARSKLLDWGKKLLSPILDRQWHLDPYKIGGFFFYYQSYIFTQKVFALSLSINTETARLAILAGLVTGLVTVGTLLFDQGRKSDETLKGA